MPYRALAFRLNTDSSTDQKLLTRIIEDSKNNVSVAEYLKNVVIAYYQYKDQEEEKKQIARILQENQESLKRDIELFMEKQISDMGFRIIGAITNNNGIAQIINEKTDLPKESNNLPETVCNVLNMFT